MAKRIVHEAAAPTPFGTWEMHALRNRRGVHTVEGSDPFGRPFVEPISVASSAHRDWSNPPEEIAHMREVAAWLLCRRLGTVDRVRRNLP